MLHPDYIVGLVDGEGSFTAHVRNPAFSNAAKRRVRIEPRFYLKLIERDKNILYELKRFFGCGNVYFQRDRRVNHQDCYRYEVGNRKHLAQVIIPFFRKHQLRLESKRKDFRIFCQLMERIQKGRHLTRSGLHYLYELKQQMH